MLYGADISQFQGVVNWDALNSVANFVFIRATDGTVVDPQFARNQSEARRVQAAAGPLGIGYYTHTYPTLLTPVESASFFVKTLGLLQAGEILAHDLEGTLGSDPVSWSLQFAQSVDALTGIKPPIYLNKSEVAAYNWQPLVDFGCGIWIADYTTKPVATDAPPAVSPWTVTAFQQWTDTDHVAGITGAVDGDVFYGDFPQFAAYGYHSGGVTPIPVTVTPPVESTPPVLPTSTATTTTTPPVGPAPSPAPASTPPPSVEQPAPANPVSSSNNPAKYSLSVTAIGQAILLQCANILTAAGLWLSSHTQDIKPQVIAGLVLGLIHLVANVVDPNIPNTPNSPD